MTTKDLPAEYLEARARLPKSKQRRTGVTHAYPKPRGDREERLAERVAAKVVARLKETF